MKIFFFIRSLEVGGSQRQLATTAAGLARRGHEVAVIVLYPGGGTEPLLHNTGVRLIALGKTGRWDVIGPFKRLRRLLASETPDVLYSFLPTQNTLAALALPKESATRLVFGLRGTTADHAKYDAVSRFMCVAEARLSRRADLVVANGDSVKADAVSRGLPEGRTIVIPNGIDTEAMKPNAAARQALRRAWGLDPNHFVIGMVARLDPMKDHRTFLAAARLFALKNQDARFVCVGAGPERQQYSEELFALSRSLGMSERIVWAGDGIGAADAYNAFDVATLSSAFGEGFPNVIGEAMACGVPVAATDVGDSRAVVGTWGEIVPPQSPGELCVAWGRLRMKLKDDGPALAASIRSHIASNFSVDLLLDRTETALTRLTRGFSAPPQS